LFCISRNHNHRCHNHHYHNHRCHNHRCHNHHNRNCYRNCYNCDYLKYSDNRNDAIQNIQQFLNLSNPFDWAEWAEKQWHNEQNITINKQELKNDNKSIHELPN